MLQERYLRNCNEVKASIPEKLTFPLIRTLVIIITVLCSFSLLKITPSLRKIIVKYEADDAQSETQLVHTSSICFAIDDSQFDCLPK